MIPTPPPTPPKAKLALRRDGQRLRRIVQAASVFLCLWIGVEFYLFLRWGSDPWRAGYVPHPAGAEAFLPISALLSLKLWLVTGVISPIHPAGLFIFVAILAIGLLLKKAFCSWLCPVGSLSEALWRLGARVLGRNLVLPAWLDYPLRAVKYLLLAFFLWVVGGMGAPALAGFLQSPFNVLADVRMYYFFARMSGLTLGVVLGLALLSVLIRNFWCRYLCPYGALLGLLSLASPLRITRNAASCIDCRKCTRACPAAIQVHEAGRVASDECTACLSCVAVCPVPDTLAMAAPGNRAVPVWVFAALVVGLFVAVTGLARLTGHWRTVVSQEDYLELLQDGQSR